MIILFFGVWWITKISESQMKKIELSWNKLLRVALHRKCPDWIPSERVQEERRAVREHARAPPTVALRGLRPPVRKSNVRVSKPKTPRARTPSTLALRRGGQNSK